MASPSVRTAIAADPGGDECARLAYGHTATLARINIGWARRKNRDEYGFLLDLERGRWAPRPEDKDLPDDDPLTGRLKTCRPLRGGPPQRPGVRPRRHRCQHRLSWPVLQSALKVAVQSEYDLEDSELQVVSLPDREHRATILLYEAAEGGAGVLRQLVEDPAALSRIARQALARCHFDPDTLADLRRAPRAREDCEAACYDCLLSYTNQPDHQLVDRMLIR